MVGAKNSLDAQVSVIGCLLLDSRLMGEAAQMIRASDFTSKPCLLCWQTMRRMWSAGQPIDAVTVSHALAGFDNVRQFVIECMEVVPSVASFQHYVSLMRQQAAMDQLKQIAAELSAAATMEEMTALIARANGLTVQRSARERMNPSAMLQSFADEHASGKPPEYIRWPFDKLNQQTDTERGDMCIIAGRPSDGKTSFALLCAWMQSEKYRVGFYSLETGTRKLRDRSVAMMNRIDMKHIKRNSLDIDEWEAFARNSDSLLRHKLDIIQAAGMTVEDIRADALANGYEIIFIDYLQLIQPSNPREVNRTAIVSDISIKLHQLAQTTGITVVPLAQLNRASTEGHKARRPGLSDLRESGQIEQDADLIIFIWREDFVEPNAPRKCFVGKNKEGQTGEFDIILEGRYQRFVEQTFFNAQPNLKGKTDHTLPHTDRDATPEPDAVQQEIPF